MCSVSEIPLTDTDKQMLVSSWKADESFDVTVSTYVFVSPLQD